MLPISGEIAQEVSENKNSFLIKNRICKQWAKL